MKSRPRMLIVSRTLGASGGGDHLKAVVIEALRDRYDLTLAQWNRPELDEINQMFGTTLRPSDFSLLRVNPAVRVLVDSLPLRFDLLKRALMFRIVRRHGCEDAIVFSVDNEIDVHRPAVQYIHYPWGLLPRPAHDLRWFHFSWLLVPYYALARHLIGVDEHRIEKNLTFVNSSWTGLRFVERYGGAPPVVLHPPVRSAGPTLPWEERESRFVSVGRISREKRIEDAIEILDRVRDRGHDVTLSIIGFRDDRHYFKEIERLAASRPWITIHERIPLAEVNAIIARSRYGIHPMLQEHFGIAVAQLAVSGCLPFVHGDGGPAEIVRDERLTFDSVAVAVDRIDAVVSSDALQRELMEKLRDSEQRFGFDRFRTTLLQSLDRWLADRETRDPKEP